MGEVIKPEDVRKGDRIQVSWTDHGVRRSDEGVVAVAGNRYAIVYVGGGTNRPTSDDRTIELLDRPKTPGQVAYEAAQRYTTNAPSWGDDSIDGEYWDRIAQAVLRRAAAKP